MGNNKGVSMLELVVVISIMAIMTGLVALGVNILPGKQVSSCCQEIKSSLQQGRAEAMRRENMSLTVTRDTKEAYVIQSVQAGEKKIGSASLSVSYKDSKGVWHEISQAKKLMISYDRASGAFRPLIKEKKENGEFLYETDASGNYVYCTEIVIKSGGYEEHLVLVRATGKVYKD